MEKITFEQLPEAVTRLYSKLEVIERLLLEKNTIPRPDPEEFLTVQEAALFMKLSVPTIYALIHQRKIPVMKSAKRCYFSKVDLVNYMKQGRQKTLAEIDSEAADFINKQKGLKNE
jgi:excisionase family DNA binding protein